MPLVEDMRRYGTRWLWPKTAERPPPPRSTVQSRGLARRPCRRRSAGGGAEAWAVRDLLLNEALKRLAAEAATRLSALVAGGDQIPFDVDADSGDDSLFYSYVPLTVALRARARERAARAAGLRPRPRRGRRGRHRRSLPGGPRRAGSRRARRARRADADRLPRLPLGRLHRVLARPRAAREGARRARRRDPRRRRGRRR